MSSPRLRAALVVLAAMTGSTGAESANGILLAPHRAVYDMTLGTSRSGSSVTAVTGRMVFEITGSACEGYTQNMRFVTEMRSNEGEPVLSDQRSSTWEDGQGRIFRFNTTQLRNQKPAETTVGDANRAGPAGEVKVDITKPAKSSKTLASGTFFPVQHSIALLEAAKSGKDKFRADIYDGSEKGEKAYDTSARIGKMMPPGANASLPSLKASDPLERMPAWPVTISYYERGQSGQDATPVYELSFVFFENGVSRRLVIDYGDFSIKGELSRIDFLEPTKCEVK
jgi:hypothetical protein